MSKFNGPRQTTQTFSPIQSESVASGRTFEGGPGFARDAKSELFLLAVTNMVSEKTFYEDANTRDARYVKLVREVAADINWLTGFFGWLRREANMRSASLVGALEAVKARLDAGLHGGNRQLVDSVLDRPDEPGEALAYWYTTYGRTLPKPVKRGIADAAVRMYGEWTLLKYDTASHGFRFADVIELTRPNPKTPLQADLFRYAIERRHNRDDAPSDRLRTVHNRISLMNMPVEMRKGVLTNSEGPTVLRESAMTWESVAGWLQGPMDKAAWEAIIPSMGYMALLRNLRNFDQAEVSDEVAEIVANKLCNPIEVSKSRQLPMRFLSAYRNAPSLRWAWPVSRALDLSLRNVTRLDGRTLVLVDTSSSMHGPFSAKSDLMRWDVAAMFGVAMAQTCDSVDLVSFSSAQRYWGDRKGANTKTFPVQVGESVLKGIDRWKNDGFFLGGGTATEAAVQQHYQGHDRVVIFTDEQATGHEAVGAHLPKHVPMYTWNIAGYGRGHAPSGSNNRHVFGGLSDSAFKMIPLLEGHRDGSWPWEIRADVSA